MRTHESWGAFWSAWSGLNSHAFRPLLFTSCLWFLHVAFLSNTELSPKVAKPQRPASHTSTSKSLLALGKCVKHYWKAELWITQKDKSQWGRHHFLLLWSDHVRDSLQYSTVNGLFKLCWAYFKSKGEAWTLARLSNLQCANFIRLICSPVKSEFSLSWSKLVAGLRYI